MSPCLPMNPLEPAESAFVARAYRTFCCVCDQVIRGLGLQSTHSMRSPAGRVGLGTRSACPKVGLLRGLDQRLLPVTGVGANVQPG